MFWKRTSFDCNTRSEKKIRYYQTHGGIFQIKIVSDLCEPFPAATPDNQIDATWSSHGKRGSGRRRTARTDENVKLVVVVVVIIIITWLVQSWTLPFLRACSMPVDSALGGRRLLAQCWMIQRSEARWDAVGLLYGSSPLAEGPH